VREPKIRGIKKCRCDERLQTKTKEFTRLPCISSLFFSVLVLFFSFFFSTKGLSVRSFGYDFLYFEASPRSFDNAAASLSLSLSLSFSLPLSLIHNWECCV
jgi:hypothetical protein